MASFIIAGVCEASQGDRIFGLYYIAWLQQYGARYHPVECKWY